MKMINWESVICFCGMVFYLCFCIYHLYDFFNYFNQNHISMVRRSVFLSIVLGFMVFGLLFLFFVAKMFFHF